ncbi:MAG: hypothetical protein ACHQHP_05690 [Bacteroidia bacterium]
MIKIAIIHLLLISAGLKTFAQEQYDVRKTKWGMTYDEVISSEPTLNPLEKDTDHIRYENVELQNGITTSINYVFKNRKLAEVSYIIYGANVTAARGTCTNRISLYDKIQFTSFIFNALKVKEMNCKIINNKGWQLQDVHPEIGLDSCKLDRENIEKMERLSLENDHKIICLYFENKRTQANFRFEDAQYRIQKLNESKQGVFGPNFPCNDVQYNEYYKIIFTPVI